MKKRLFCLAFALLFCAGLCACAPTEEPVPETDFPVSAAVIPSTQKLLRDEDLPANDGSALAAKMVKNESEGMQFAVRFDREVKDVKVVLSELKNESGDTLQATLYRQHYIYVTSYNGGKAGYGVGWYPDALIPAFDGSDGALATDTMDIPANRNQGYWITVTSRADQTPGIYTGTATVYCGGARGCTLPVAVTVYDIALSEATPFYTSYGLWDPSFYSDVGFSNEDTVAMYWDFFLQYRISCGSLPFDNLGMGIDEAGAKAFAEKAVQWLNEHPRASVFRVPLHGVAGLGKQEPGKVIAAESNTYTYNALKEAGLLDRVFVYPIDEPPVSTAGNKLVNDVAGDVNSAFPGLRMVIPTTSYRSEFDDVLNVQCPLVNYVSEEMTASLIERGIEPWWYTCLNPQYPYPTYLVNDSLLSPRLLHWMARDYNVQGLLYWGATLTKKLNSAKTAYSEPAEIWRDVYRTPGSAGDGYLCYPGKVGDGVVDRNMPVPTLRLESVRDGIEDYMLLTMLKDKFTPTLTAAGLDADAALDTYFDALYTDTDEYNTSSAVFEAVRAQVLDDLCAPSDVFVATETAFFGMGNKRDAVGRRFAVVAPVGAKMVYNGTEFVATEPVTYINVDDADLGGLCSLTVNGRTYERFAVVASGNMLEKALHEAVEKKAAQIGCSATLCEASYKERLLGASLEAKSPASYALASVVGDDVPLLVTTETVMSPGDALPSVRVYAYVPQGAEVTCDKATESAKNDKENYSVYSFLVPPQESDDVLLLLTVKMGETIFTREEYFRSDRAERLWVVTEPTEMRFSRETGFTFAYDLPENIPEGATGVSVTLRYTGEHTYARFMALQIDVLKDDGNVERVVVAYLPQENYIFFPGVTTTYTVPLPTFKGTPVAVRLTATRDIIDDPFVLEQIEIH